MLCAAAALAVNPSGGAFKKLPAADMGRAAIVTPNTLARAWRWGIRPADRLADNDGHGFFEALGDQVITGPTRTNVNDFRAILITASAR